MFDIFHTHTRGVNLEPFWASLEALVALIVFLVSCLS